MEFLLGAVVSLGASWQLVIRLERVGARLGLSEALLGLLAALAADAPEITTAVSALVNHQAKVGAGVAIGSNLFNLAALLGLAALVAGRIALHRRVVMMEGAVAIWVAGVALLAVLGVVAPAVGLALVLLVLVPYAFALGAGSARLERLGLPAAWVAWVESAIGEAELELEEAVHPKPGHAVDVVVGLLATAIVVGASVVMEHAGAKLGAQNDVPEVITGGLVLAGVTSVPNAVAGIYLAARGRGAATLSTSLNSNIINIAAGLLLPGTILGLGVPSGPGDLVAAANVGLTLFVLAGAYRYGGLRRGFGALIVLAYVAFAVALALAA